MKVRRTQILPLDSHGYSLIEAMIVIGIFSLMAVGATKMFSDMYQNEARLNSKNSSREFSNEAQSVIRTRRGGVAVMPRRDDTPLLAPGPSQFHRKLLRTGQLRSGRRGVDETIGQMTVAR